MKGRTPCPCQCRCGATGHDGSLCYLCAGGWHHTCGRACGEYRTPYGYIAPRGACRGGRR